MGLNVTRLGTNCLKVAARLERSSFCEEVRRAKKREWKRKSCPNKK